MLTSIKTSLAISSSVKLLETPPPLFQNVAKQGGIFSKIIDFGQKFSAPLAGISLQVGGDGVSSLGRLFLADR